jgi:hypothetical protein
MDDESRARHPLSGSVFCVQVETPGAPAAAFGPAAFRTAAP